MIENYETLYAQQEPFFYRDFENNENEEVTK